VSFLIMSKQLNSPFIKFVSKQKTKSFKAKIKYKIFSIEDVFEYVNTGYYHVSGDLDAGKTPLISCKTIENGTEGYYDINENTFENCVTIASDGSWPMSSFYHPYKFASKDNVIICKPKKEIDLKTILFVTAQLNSQIWRFSYGRKCYLNKTDKIQIPLPVNKKNEIDFAQIHKIVDSCSIWNEIRTF